MLSFRKFLKENKETFFHAILVSGNPHNENSYSIVAHGDKKFETPEEALNHIKTYKNKSGDESAIIYRVVNGVGEKHSVESVA